MSRIHPFEAVENFRDYGDYATTAGRRLRPGRLLRSGHHARASDEDLRRLADLAPAVVVDLRRKVERDAQPSRRPAGFSGRVIETPGAEDDLSEAPHIQFLKTNDLTETSGRAFMREAYRRLPFEAAHVDLFSRYFQALAEADGPVLIHCAAGKDRTGVLAALTHHLAGVGEDAMLEDYLLTNTAVRLEARAPHVARQLEQMTGRKASHAAVVAFLGVEADYLRAAFAEIEARHGTLDAYLARVLGVDRAMRGRIEARLCD